MENGEGRVNIETTEGRDGDAMVEMMRVSMEDRRRREAEYDEERQRRQVEASRREEQSLRQIEVLQSLVEGVQLQGEVAMCKVECDKGVRVPKLTEEDDIVSYLTTFERLMRAYEVKQERWAFKLASHQSGRAQKAYSAMPTGTMTSSKKPS